jgi:beta-ureidopropionase / N-carbamoyl-L-amino-acid hydrolase
VITLAQLNALAPVEFATALDGIFEHTAWVAQRSAAMRPFGSRLQLLDAMRSAVDQASAAEQLALIRAHPKLGVRAAANPLTPASAHEQRRAGLGACTAAEAADLQQLNAHYLERFGIPFILAVRGHDPVSIIANLRQRLDNDSELEQRTALRQIGAIAAYRLAERIGSAPGAEVVAMLARLAACSRPGTAAGTAAALVREWMLAAGLALWPADGVAIGAGYLMGCVTAGESASQILLAGACRNARRNTVRYLGTAAFVVAIEAAQQLRLAAARTALGLAVLARPDDVIADGSASGLVGDARQEWIELGSVAGTGAIDVADAETMDILAALHGAQVADSTLLLVREPEAAPGQRGPAKLTAAAAERAVRALEAMLGRAQTAA